MRTATLKLKNSGGIKIVNNSNLSRKILKTIFGSFGVLVLCYLLLLGSMIFNIVERKSLEAEARTIANEVGDLELQYLSLSNKIDLNYASTLGFKESSEKKYTSRKSLGRITGVANEL